MTGESDERATRTAIETVFRMEQARLIARLVRVGGDVGLAEDLTAESFLAAVDAVRRPGASGPSIPWLIGVARHKLADLAARADALADAVDPTAAFLAFIRELTAEAKQNVALTGALGGAGIGAGGADAATALSVSLGRLLARAQQDSRVRADLTVPDLHAILSGVISMERNLSAEHQGIGLEIVIAGLTTR